MGSLMFVPLAADQSHRVSFYGEHEKGSITTRYECFGFGFELGGGETGKLK